MDAYWQNQRELLFDIDDCTHLYTDDFLIEENCEIISDEFGTDILYPLVPQLVFYSAQSFPVSSSQIFALVFV